MTSRWDSLVVGVDGDVDVDGDGDDGEGVALATGALMPLRKTTATVAATETRIAERRTTRERTARRSRSFSVDWRTRVSRDVVHSAESERAAVMRESSRLVLIFSTLLP